MHPTTDFWIGALRTAPAAALLAGIYFIGALITAAESGTLKRAAMIELAEAFTTTYAQNRDEDDDLPAEFRAHAIAVYASRVAEAGGVADVTFLMPGPPGKEISTVATSADVRAAITALEQDPRRRPITHRTLLDGTFTNISIYPSIAASQGCVDCHNHLLGGDVYRLGDVMGAYVVSTDMSQAVRSVAAQSIVLALGIAFVGGARRVRDARAQRVLAAAERDAARERERAQALRGRLAAEEDKAAIQRKFVSVLSHEFRTPLAIIDGQCRALTKRIDRMGPEAIVNRAVRIRGAVKRMVRLMETLLFSSRIEAGKLSPEIETFDLQAMARELCEDFDLVAETHSLRVDLDALPTAFEGDQLMLRQALSNLLSNAIKYSPEADVVDVSARTEGRWLAIDVRDYGVGVPQDEMSRLFTRFFRASTASGIAGTGIGLEVVREILRAHGGDVAAVSAPGEGSTFTLALPAPTPARRGAPDAVAAA